MEIIQLKIIKDSYNYSSKRDNQLDLVSHNFEDININFYQISLGIMAVKLYCNLWSADGKVIIIGLEVSR